MPSAPPMSPLTTSYFTCDAERDGVVCRYTQTWLAIHGALIGDQEFDGSGPFVAAKFPPSNHAWRV
jgi:hypothetical protein